MKKLLLAFIAIPLISFSQSSVYGVDPFNGNLEVMDTTTFTVTNVGLTSGLGAVTGCNGLSDDGMGNLYVVYKISGISPRHLGTLDVSTGAITDVGALSDNIATIAFDGSGTLYGVTGDGAAVTETMYTINLSLIHI